MFLESECMNDFADLKEKLMEEFKCSRNSADVHQLLRKKIKKSSEHFHEYMLHMKKNASVGNVEEAAKLRQIKNEYKVAVRTQGCST